MGIFLTSLWLPFLVGTVLGFSTHPCPQSSWSDVVFKHHPTSRMPSDHRSFNRRNSHPPRGQSIPAWRMAASLEDGDVIGDYVQPRPPDYPPRIDEQLEQDLTEAERRVMLYEKEVEMVRDQLNLKQDELMEERNVFREEKNNMMSKIIEFTKLLAQRDQEIATVAEAPPPPSIDPEREAALMDEIRSLKDELVEKVETLQKEQSSTRELRKRFEEAQDALEFEQMNFEKERKSLQQMVANERNQLKEVEGKFQKSTQSFETTRQELINRISVEEQKLSDTKSKWKETQAQLQQVEEKLKAAFEEKSKVLQESDRKLSNERALLREETTGLQQQIKSEEAKVAEARRELQEERKLFEDSKIRLESLIQVEQKRVVGLQNELETEQKKYESEKNALDKKITEISSALSYVESELANERVNFSKEKKQLEQRLADEVRVGKLKKRQMKERYDQIRREMTDLWESSKRQARQEENRLRKKYQKRIDDVTSQVFKLQDDLASSEKSQDDMKLVLGKLTQEKERMLLEQTSMELKYTEELQLRDASIARLESNVETLRQTILEKDATIQQKQAQIEGYETSLRQVFKLGFVVTGNKIKSVGRPLRRLIQNSPPPDV